LTGADGQAAVVPN